MMIQKSPYSFLRSLVKGQDDSFFKNLTGVFCTVGGTLVWNIFAPITLKFGLSFCSKELQFKFAFQWD
jgi:hypothetical protein